MLLERFIVENPSHTKTARAETLMGVLYFKLGLYPESIRILGDPDRRLRDPGAYLTTLRTLGRAYAATSRIENAQSAFIYAASLEENISPDQDYVELGLLYQKLAERSDRAVGRCPARSRAAEESQGRHQAIARCREQSVEREFWWLRDRLDDVFSTQHSHRSRGNGREECSVAVRGFPEGI